jgi:hypothetical protein
MTNGPLSYPKRDGNHKMFDTAEKREAQSNFSSGKTAARRNHHPLSIDSRIEQCRNKKLLSRLKAYKNMMTGTKLDPRAFHMPGSNK